MSSSPWDQITVERKSLVLQKRVASIQAIPRKKSQLKSYGSCLESLKTLADGEKGFPHVDEAIEFPELWRQVQHTNIRID